jgi:hypothetical protein
MFIIREIEFDVSSRVNAVETLYSAFPAFMFIDPDLGAPLLEPLFRLQASSFNNSVQYAAGDLGKSRMNSKSTIFRPYIVGSNYPNVTSTNSTHNKGVERPYLSIEFCTFLTRPSHRDREYADHDIRLCTRYWGWKPHK